MLDELSLNTYKYGFWECTYSPIIVFEGIRKLKKRNNPDDPNNGALNVSIYQK